MTLEGYARDLVRAIQDTRKEMGFEVTDRLQLSLTSENEILANILKTHTQMIETETLCTFVETLKETSKNIELDEGIQVTV